MRAAANDPRPAEPAPARTGRGGWPLPALLAWSAAWVIWTAASRSQLPVGLAFAVAAVVVPGLIAWNQRSGLRRVVVLGGFPLSLWAAGGLTVGPWVWLAALLALLLAYPWQSWSDAPWWPTRAGALHALPPALQVPSDALMLDAGCGTGDGLRELRRQFPLARLEGVERSALLAMVARRRCPSALVRRGDMWRESWFGYDVVYLFQRPETMQRAWDKANLELRAGAWVVSLEFPVPGVAPHATVAARGDGTRALHVYRIEVAGVPLPVAAGAPLPPSFVDARQAANGDASAVDDGPRRHGAERDRQAQHA